MAKLVFNKTWKIELLYTEDDDLQLTLQQVMMTICHPTNNKFVLFHSIDKSEISGILCSCDDICAAAILTMEIQ